MPEQNIIQFCIQITKYYYIYIKNTDIYKEENFIFVTYYIHSLQFGLRVYINILIFKSMHDKVHMLTMWLILKEK